MSTSLQRHALAAALFFLTACSAVTVTTDYDHSVPFGKYRTYLLTSSPPDLPLAPSSEAALHDTLKTALAARGLSEVPENADLHVVRHVSTKEKITVYPANDREYGAYPYPYGRYGMWAGAPPTYANVSEYTEGTLILDFVDAKTQKLVFRGVAQGTVGKPGTNAPRVREAVEKIVREYPGSGAP